MSLLNEMLHDLAKQKHAKQVTPLYIPALHPSRSKSSKGIFLLILAVFTFIFYWWLSSQHPQKADIRTVPNASEENASIPAPMYFETIQEPPAAIPPSMPVQLVSYIEPLTSPASQRVAIPLPVVANVSNDWIANQEEPSSSVVNKVYASQTLEEWHDEQFNKALQAIDKGLDEQAIVILQAILVKVPNATDARENLASLYLVYGDFAHATEVVDEGLKYSPANVSLITIKARLLLDQGKTLAAIGLLSKHRPSIMSYPDFYATLAAAFQSEGRILEAGNLYRSLIQIDPKDGRYWLGYAIALEHNNKLNQAIEAYNRASQSPETDPTVLDYAEKRLKVLQG